MALPPQPPQQPPTEVEPVVLDKFTGVKNTVTREKLKPEEFELAQNVDLDDVGQVHRRRGQTLVASARYHSLYTAENNITYGVKDGVLGIINPDYSFVPLQSGMGDNPVAYVLIDITLYFSSISNSGKINTVTNTVAPWGVIGGNGEWISPVVNPTPTLAPIEGKLYGPPPLAKYLTYYNGRIYLAVDKVVWTTVLYLYDVVDRTQTYLPFEAEVTGLGTVGNGIYVGTSESTWFLSGPQLREFKRISLTHSGTIPGSMIPISGELMNPHNTDQPTQAENAVAFMTPAGLCVGLDGGEVYNISQNHIWFPFATHVSPMWRKQDGMNQYVGVLDSGGTPFDNARIGDHLDGRIIRAADLRKESAFHSIGFTDKFDGTIIRGE